MNGCPNPAQIMALARKDPIVQAAVNLWQAGRVTWEQAMMAAVATLSESHSHLMKATVETIMRSTFPGPFQVPPGMHAPGGACSHPEHQAPPPPPPAAAAPSPAAIDATRILHVLVSEICTCGVTHSIAPEDHHEDCRGNTLVRRLKSPPQA